MFKFIVATNPSYIPQDTTIIMVDGTVPNYQFNTQDFHFDHHRENGHDIQLTEIPLGIFAGCDQSIELNGDECFVTTQVDADACVAAASIILATMLPDDIAHLEYGTKIPEWYARFEAIAYDCDHLGVPLRLSHLGDFAAKVVAAMKQTAGGLVEELSLPTDRRGWTEDQKVQYASTAFERGTMSLVNAALGKSPYPGEAGEADEYFTNVERQVFQYADRVSLVKPEYWNTKSSAEYLLFDGRGINEYVDPRVWIKIAKSKWDVDNLPPETITVRDRKDNQGLSYTIGVVPCHPQLEIVEYCKFHVYGALTSAERNKNPDWDKDGTGWGGRKTVGGSSWNSGSLLSPQEVAWVLYKSPKWVIPYNSFDGDKFWCDSSEYGRDFYSIDECGSAFVPSPEEETRYLEYMKKNNTSGVPNWL